MVQAGGRPRTDAEFARLPAYCRARWADNNSQQRRYWGKRMGKSFGGMHHYCAGLNLLNKTLGTTDKNARNELLRGAIKEIEMIREYATKDFYLRPEMGNKVGNSYLRLGSFPEAINEFSKGIRLYPKYTLNYVGLSKIYKKQDHITEAKKILELGLKHIPSSKLLKKRLKRLE